MRKLFCIKHGIVSRLSGKAAYFLRVAAVEIRYAVLHDYYFRLGIQAKYLYRQSELFKLRWQQVGLEYAEGSFTGEVAYHFFRKAKHEPFGIRWRILKDSVLRRPVQTYYLLDY